MSRMLQDGEVRLRALEPEDLEWLYTVENDTDLWRWGNANVPYSRYVLKTYIAESRHDIYADGQLRLAITSACGDEVMGCVDLVHFDALPFAGGGGYPSFSRLPWKGLRCAGLKDDGDILS